MKSDYEDKFIEKLVRSLLMIAGIFYFALAIFGESFFKLYLGDQWLQALFVVFGFSGIYVCIDRDYYLPFLGDAVFPDGLLPPHTSPMSANLQHTLKKLPPNTKVIYWAAEPCEVTETCGIERMPWEAYTDYTNAGITTSNEKGEASIKIRGKPQSYNVPYKSEVIMPHVHFRYRKSNGMYSKVYTSSF
jgi:hypothetical protein